MFRMIRTTTLLALLILLVPGVTGFADDTEFKITYRANAIALGHGLASQLQMTITRWTTPEERENLLKILTEQGQDAMIKVLEKSKETGFLRLPNTMGYRLYYAHQIQDGPNRRIVLATDRPVSMAEAWRNNRSLDYAITLIQLQMNEKDEGEGWMGFAVEIKVDPEKRTLQIENYGTDPVQLRNVRRSN